MKKSLSIKTKLSLYVLFTSLLCSIIIGGISYINFKENLIKYMGIRAENIAQAISANIDGDEIEKYNKTGQTDDYYQTLVDYLDKVKKDINISFAYIMEDAGNQFKYIAEAQTDPDAAQLGDTDGKDQYGPEPDEVLSTGTALYTGIQSSSDYADMLSGFAPITNKAGAVVGVIGIDIDVGIINQSLNQYIPIILILMVFSCLISFALIYIAVNKLVVKPIKALESASEEMAGGKLNINIPSKYLKKKDEIGCLFAAFTSVLKQINLIIHDISHVLTEMSQRNLTVETCEDYAGDFIRFKISVDNILGAYNSLLNDFGTVTDKVYSSSTQVSDISGDLAQDSVRQSTAVEELSATISNISRNANNTVQNVKQAKDYIFDMNRNVEVSTEQMNKMLSAMNDISTSSSEISKIIKIIDDITFQTNILALNAAVEAARAGEAGKGFAVVADEVRNLASKTSDAASQTSSLIISSINAVKRGSSLAEQTAKALNDVSAKEKQVNNTIDEIAKASNDQSHDISEVLNEINQISEVAQNNSARSQESAASSKELAGFAEQLDKELSEFQLKSESKNS